MFNTYESIKEYLNAGLTLYAPISLNGLTSKTESISLRSIPTNADGIAYDKKKSRLDMFQIMTKSINQKTAMNTIELIAELLNNADFEDADSNMIYCEIYSEPSFLEKTNSNEYIFTSVFFAEIEKGR